MKKLVWLTLICGILAGIGIWWWSTSSRSVAIKGAMMERYAPHVTISSMNVTAIKEDTVQINAGVNINNTSPIDLHIKRFSYQVYIQEEKIADERYDQPVTISSFDSGVINLPIRLWAKPMQEQVTILRRNKQDSMICRVVANVIATIPFTGEKSFPVNARKKLPLKQLQELSIQNMNLRMEKGTAKPATNSGDK